MGGVRASSCACVHGTIKGRNCYCKTTMSDDRLKDLELELRDVVVALKDVAGTQWYDLGLQLRLSPSTLDTIASDHQTADDCKRMMLRKWLQSDPEASWEKLAAALTLTGHKTTAAVIRRQFSLVRLEEDGGESTDDEDKIRRFTLHGYVLAVKWKQSLYSGS